ncbi:MAG: response regulator [Cyclobacteriaceae bacterium]|nr:response regulator [Cyclobacteriaceae bacterium]UYN85470.1 MAG: response regulator [Cyclobacteriaceae bacterium]
MSTKVFYLFNWLLIPLCLVAQENVLQKARIKLDHLSVEQGLSQSSVLSLLQDTKGFMWLGTRDGLNLYDAYQFTVFRNNRNDSTSIGGNYINSLAEDAEGNIWIATDQGLSCYHRAQGFFSSFIVPVPATLEGEVRKVVVDKKNEVWLGTPHGLMKFDRQSQSIIRLEKFQTSFAGHSITSLFSDSKNNLWVGTARHGLFVLAPNRTDFRQPTLVSSPEISGSNRIEAMAEDLSGNIWIGTYGKGLFFLSGNISKHYHSQSKELPLVNNNIRALQCDSNGNIWVGTFDGLSVVLKNQEAIRTMRTEEGVPDGLRHNSIRSLHVDRKGSVWIGTYFGGVHIFDRDNQRFEHFFHIPTNSNSLSYDVVGAFTEDHEGRVWIGTERGGISIRNLSTDEHIHLQHDPDKANTLSGNTVKALTVDDHGQVWAGIFRGGLNKINPRNCNVTRYPANQEEFKNLSRSIVNCIVPGGNILWLGTDDLGGLQKFDLKKNEFSSFGYREELMAVIGSSPVKDIWIDEQNNLWLATRGSGVIVFNEAHGIVKHFTRLTHGLPTNEFTSIMGVQNTIIAGSLGEGVLMYDREQLKFTQLTVAEGLLNNLVLGTLADDQEQLWFSAINGLSHYNSVTGQFTNYSNVSGLPLLEMNEGAFYRMHSGKFLIGGSNGYILFDPSRIQRNEFVPPVVFTDILLYNKSVRPNDGSGILQSEVVVEPTLRLDWHHTVFTVEFAALNFLRSSKNQYQYFLEGFDTEWREAGNRRSITYTNLRDGSYTLFVKGSNNDGVWNEQPVKLRIHVLPPPWKTWWAYTGYAIIIVGGFLLIRYNAIKSAHLKHELKWEQKDKERMQELHGLKLQYFTDVSHEFRTPLTLIVNPLDELLQSEEGSPWIKKQLRTMYYNCRRMLLLIDQVLEMHQVEAGHAALETKPVSIITIVSHVVGSFQGLADHRNISLVFKPIKDRYLYPVDVDKLEKILFNLLSNAFKFTDDGGLIQIHVRMRETSDKTWYVIRVSDTGRGIPADDLEKIFERFYKDGKNRGSGIGLSLAKSLVDLMEGQIQVSSTLGEGTTFTIRLPFTRLSEPAEVTIENTSTRPLPVAYQVYLSEQRQENTAAELDKVRILVVEDNKELRLYLKTQLQKHYEVITARNGESGLHRAKKFGPQLIVSDVMMDEMDGIELCRQVKSDITLSHIPVILLTAKGTDTDRLTGLAEGADDYVAKPFIMRELELRMANILTNRKRVHELYHKTNRFVPEAIKVTSHDEKLMEKFIKTVELNISSENLSVEYIRQELGLSRVHLFRKIKALTGQGPADFIRNYRLQRAEQLLQQNNLRVAEISYEVGFQDVTYFSKCFKKAYGCSPTEYMQTIQTKV